MDSQRAVSTSRSSSTASAERVNASSPAAADTRVSQPINQTAGKEKGIRNFQHEASEIFDLLETWDAEGHWENILARVKGLTEMVSVTSPMATKLDALGALVEINMSARSILYSSGAYPSPAFTDVLAMPRHLITILDLLTPEERRKDIDARLVKALDRVLWEEKPAEGSKNKEARGTYGLEGRDLGGGPEGLGVRGGGRAGQC